MRRAPCGRSLLFFFQAEDGIRDWSVTGVQTCALPITTNVSPMRVPPSVGQEVDLSFGGVGYRLAVFALGSWRYRVCLDGRAVTVTLREADRHLARLEFADRTRRVVYDASEVGLRLELDGRPYGFGWETTGHVRAATPAMVVGVQVTPGERVAAGQVLGFLEAMKVEISFC